MPLSSVKQIMVIYDKFHALILDELYIYNTHQHNFDVYLLKGPRN